MVDADQENGGFMATVVYIARSYARIREINEESDELNITKDRISLMPKER